MRFPAKTDVTLVFGSTDSPYSRNSPHMGTDFAYLPDNRIYAPFSGIVNLVPNNGRDGNGLYMANGSQFHGLLHTSQYLVANGQQVKEGQPIAIMGNTGFAEGVHLHWAVKENGYFIDPMSLATKEDIMDEKTVKAMYRGTLHRDPESETAWQYWVGKSAYAFLDQVIGSEEWKSQNGILQSAYPEALGKITALGKKLDEAPSVINRDVVVSYINKNLK